MRPLVRHRHLLIAATLAALFTLEMGAEASAPLAVAPIDPTIQAALTQVSAETVRATVVKLVSFGNRSTLSSTETDLPSGTGVTAAADWIFSEFGRISAACGGCMEVKRDDFVEPGAAGTRIVRDTRLQNIYAVLKGTDPAQASRRVLVTGHYDSRNSENADARTPAPGANDDATGVAVSIECARVLSKLRFPSTIVFAAVAGEEQGLNGSRHLARLAKAEGWQLEAVLNDDIVGGDTTPGATGQDKMAVRVFSEGVPGPATLEQLRAIQTVGAESDSSSRELARAIADVDRTYFHAEGKRSVVVSGQIHGNAIKLVPGFHPVLIFRRDRFLRGGDHTSFNLEGFTAVRFTEWQENFNHQHQNLRVENGVQYGDLIEYDDFNYVANVARLNAAVLATLASAPGVPRNVGVVTTGLDNDTTLRWESPKGMPEGAGFEIVSRDTSAPDWTDAVSAGTATTVTLRLSKDNTIFGVRSVDAAGHRSMAVYPMPIRSGIQRPVAGTGEPASTTPKP